MAKVRCGEVRLDLLCIYRDFSKLERMWSVLWELVT